MFSIYCHSAWLRYLSQFAPRKGPHTMRNRTVIAIAIGAAAGLTATARAEDFPTHNVTIIVPFPPGGGNDILGRLIGQRLAGTLGRMVIVENRAGANGNIGAQAVVRAAPDGHTMLYANSSIATANVIPPKATFDSQRDLAPVSMTALIPFVLVVHPSLPVRSVKDLLALAKAKPGALTYGAGGIGLPMELLKFNANIDVRGIFYKGAAPATVALLSGEVQMSLQVPVIVQSHIRNGKARGLAVSSLNRSTVLPEMPTLHEAGVKDFEALQWHGFFVPAKTPTATVTRIHADIVKALVASELKERFAAEGAEIVGSTPSQFTAFISSEIKKWADVVQRSGMKF
jgi:tripartite-type tricarboxylate transporter receptor subunit TctC